jgi:formylglycine-generating enzyme required for sulfatase activity
MTFCWIPPGEFVMGSPTTEGGRGEDEAQVKVTLSKGFWLGKYEVTQAQWAAAGGVDPSGRAPWSEDGEVKVSWAELSESGVRASNFKGNSQPVERVTWTEARDWCADLNVNEGSEDDPAGGWRYGLPTEAQWEYAARAGTSTGLNSGKELSSEDRTCRNLDEVGWYWGNSGQRTHPVGQKKPNAWGLHDMHGNVFEWCGDWYGDTLPGGVDPKGAASGNCRVADRDSYFPSLTSLSIGFRVARSSVP